MQRSARKYKIQKALVQKSKALLSNGKDNTLNGNLELKHDPASLADKILSNERKARERGEQSLSHYSTVLSHSVCSISGFRPTMQPSTLSMSVVSPCSGFHIRVFLLSLSQP